MTHLNTLDRVLLVVAEFVAAIRIVWADGDCLALW
jgi:hypothetical protein